MLPARFSLKESFNKSREAKLTIEQEAGLHLVEATEATVLSESQIHNKGLLLIGPEVETETRSRYTRK